jgi:predicted glycosyltransferase
MMTPCLDILIYAHDGRGLGHASRSVAIGMALRRLYPELKIFFISGTPFTAELIGCAPLDFLKLPAYATQIINGKSKGITGPGNFSDKEIGKLRAAAIKQVIELYQPQVVLCDHSPLGKHRELLPAQQAAKNTKWVLGIRGVVGAVPQVFSEEARTTFKQHFSQILWYGDEAVLGHQSLDELTQCFACPPAVCGYVSRLNELIYWQGQTMTSVKKYAATVSIPWQSEQTSVIVRNLATAIQRIGPQYGDWKIFLGRERGQNKENVCNPFNELAFVTVEPPGNTYGEILAKSKTALIYGGYNSITDVLSLDIPTVVLLRSLQDKEQEQHLQQLGMHTGNLLCTLPERQANAETLEKLLRSQLTSKPAATEINLNGAESSARYLVKKHRL